MTFPHRVTVCICEHQKRDHYCTKADPHGPCNACGCLAFTPERACRCGHGKKAHKKGYCHESDGCKQFRPVA